MRRFAAVVLAGIVGGGCGSEAGIGLRLLSTEIRAGGTPKVAVSVFVTEKCFFSVLLNHSFKASGRWEGGNHEVLIPGYLLAPSDNVVRIDVAGDDGSSAMLETPLDYCESGQIACGDVIPDGGGPPPEAGEPDSDPEPEPDAGVPDDGRHDRICVPCTNDPVCGGLPNECVFLWVDQYGNYWGECGTYCGDGYPCPSGYQCTPFSNDAGEGTWLCFPPAPNYICP